MGGEEEEDVAYSLERKAAVLAKMLPPNNVPLHKLSQEEGISKSTLCIWRAEARAKGQLLPDGNSGPEGWTARDKFAAVVETAAMNESELGEYCGVCQSSCHLNLFHAASRSCPAMGAPPPASWGSASAPPRPRRPSLGRSGLSQTDPTGSQFRVLPDQRAGFLARAA